MVTIATVSPSSVANSTRLTHENDRADIASSKAVLRQTAVQDHVFQFLNHLLLRKRGSCNESRCVTLVVNKPSRANVQHASVRHLQRSVNNVSCSEPCLFFACNLVVRSLLPQSSLQLFPSLGIKTPPLSFLAELPRFENSRNVETISGVFFQSKPASEFFGGNRTFLFRTRSRAFDDRQELTVCA